MQLAKPHRAALETPGERVAVMNARWYFAGLAASLVGNSAMSLVAGIWLKSLTGSSSQATATEAVVALSRLPGYITTIIERR